MVESDICKVEAEKLLPLPPVRVGLGERELMEILIYFEPPD